MEKRAEVIGGGLAGCEAAWQLASRGVQVTLYECKPFEKSPAHTMDTFAELVCSNSLKTTELSAGSGLLKEELTRLGSLLIYCAKKVSVQAGSALAVDREGFSRLVTQVICSHPNITVVNKTCDDITPKENQALVVASGPLTNAALIPALQKFAGDFLHFFDAVAPIVYADSIDYEESFWGARYGKGSPDYLNCPMDREQFEIFYQQLITAKTAAVKDFEKNVFEGCMPIEVLAQRGIDAIRYGMLKPVGLSSPEKQQKPYAVLQLRKENEQGTLLNLVGCQTHLTFSEQKRVFSLIPALKNAQFARYGVMHKNTYIHSPSLLTPIFSAKSNDKLFFAGQMTGVEGYVESIASGLIAGIGAYYSLNGKHLTEPNNCTMIGALAAYISTPNKNFAPMNANFGLLPPPLQRIRDKKEKKLHMANVSLDSINQYAELIGTTIPNII